MSYTLLSQTRPKARKRYWCIWCPEHIEAGEVHVHEVSKYYGELQDQRWHLECLEAATRHFHETQEYEFEEHACKRGTAEER